MPVANPIGQASFSSTPYSYTPLLSDGDDVVTRPATVATAVGVVLRGTIGNWNSGTKAFTVPTAGGEATCNAILVNDTDPTGGTVGANVYVSGKFKADACIYPAGAAKPAIDDALRGVGIYIETVQNPSGLNITPYVVSTEGMTSEQLEAQAKQLEEQAKQLHAEAQKLQGQAKANEADAKRAEEEAKQAEAEAKKAESEAAKKGEAEKKEAEAQAKQAKPAEGVRQGEHPAQHAEHENKGGKR